MDPSAPLFSALDLEPRWLDMSMIGGHGWRLEIGVRGELTIHTNGPNLGVLFLTKLINNSLVMMIMSLRWFSYSKKMMTIIQLMNSYFIIAITSMTKMVLQWWHHFSNTPTPTPTPTPPLYLHLIFIRILSKFRHDKKWYIASKITETYITTFIAQISKYNLQFLVSRHSVSIETKLPLSHIPTLWSRYF